MRLGWLVLVVPACSFTPGTLFSDASSDSRGDADVTAGWSTPVELAELHDPLGIDDPSLTNDLLEIYFGSSTSGAGTLGMEDIWVAKRASVDDPFGPPAPVPELNSALSETTMKITGGGKATYFASDRGGAGHNIYFATRPELDQPWSVPMLISELSTGSGDWGPFAQTDQLRVVLCSGPTPAQEALYVSSRASTGVPWQAPTRIDELDVADKTECDPVEPRSGVLYYASNHLSATFDIYRASRISSTSPYGNRTAITGVNLPGINDRDPWVSPDERTMVFTSDRVGGTTQLYITTRR